MGTPRPVAPFLLLEPSDSAYARRIEIAALEAGLSVEYLDSIEAAPVDAPLIGVGPTIRDPLHVARHRRAVGPHAMLVFFTATTSARAALQAELARDPFLYPRFELVELPENARQLASRMGRVASNAKRQLHARRRPRRTRLRTSPTQMPHGVVGAEQFLAHVLAHSHDAILSTDATGRITTWNNAAEGMFGMRAASAIGRRISLLDVAEERCLSQLAADAVAARESQDARVRCRASSGTEFEVAVSVSPLRDSSGSVVGTSIIARDDSEFLRVQETLHEANRQKDEFLAIMSHELRTPLTSILGYTDMLLRGLSGPLAPLANKYLGNVRSAGDRLLELVNGLLDYTRLEAGVEHMDIRPIDIRDLVVQAVGQYQGSARAKDVELGMSVAEGFATQIPADEQKLAQVLGAYVGNALKFTPAGGRIGIHVGPDPDVQDAVRVSVTDSGVGMREEQIDRIWERFYQADASLTRAYGGMGLGLSIARHLVTLHGGRVGAYSRGPGLGSTFWFTLPRS